MMSSHDPYYLDPEDPGPDLDPAQDPDFNAVRRGRHRAPHQNQDPDVEPDPSTAEFPSADLYARPPHLRPVEPDPETYRPPAPGGGLPPLPPMGSPLPPPPPPPASGPAPGPDPGPMRTPPWGRPPPEASPPPPAGPPPAARPPAGPPPAQWPPPPRAEPPQPGQSFYESPHRGLFDDEDDQAGDMGFPAEPPLPPPMAAAGAVGAEAAFGPPGFGAHAPDDQDFLAPVPRRVDLPDDVLAPLGTGGRRLVVDEEAPDPYADPYESGRTTAIRQYPDGPREHVEEEPEPPHPASAVGLWLGAIAGLILLAAGALGFAFVTGPAGKVAAALVVTATTATCVRRGLGATWWVSWLVGVVPAALVLAGSLGPTWASPALAVYAIGTAGAAAVLLTKPVRRLSYLVLEYVVAVGFGLAGAGAVVGIMADSTFGAGNSAIGVVAGVTIALAAAARARSRLAIDEPSGGDHAFYAAFVLAVAAGVGAVAVMFGMGSSFLATGVERVQGLLLDFRLIIILPLAVLGSAVVIRAFTSNGWWLTAGASLSTSAMAAAGGLLSGSGRTDIAPTLASSFVGYVLGFLVTVVVALGIGMRMRTDAARRARRGEPTRIVEEPDRLGAL